MNNKEWLASLKVGDEVTRWLGNVLPQPLTVSEVTGERIICGWWEFDKQTGAEIDEDLGWDGKTHTGSIIKPVEKKL